MIQSHAKRARARRRRFCIAPALVLLATGAAAPVLAQSSEPFRQNRADVSGRSGAVVAGHPLAAAAGYQVLRRGGNAVDAAVTMAAVLAVVRPHMNGVGGDAFALFYEASTRRITGLNGSGRAGALATPDLFAQRGLDEVPDNGALTITVPGAVSAWTAALERYGTITLADALAPAIELAENGWVVTATLQRDIAEAVQRLNDGGRAIFAPGGELPAVGAVLRNPALARTLRTIAEGGADAFYRGSIAEQLARFVEAEGGYLRVDDFRQHQPQWVEPLSAQLAGGRRAWAMPPNSQGFVQLSQLAMSEHYDLAQMQHNSAEYLHTLIEIKKLAFADRDRWLADPAFAPPPLDRLLEGEYLRRRATLVGTRAAERVPAGVGAPMQVEPASGDGDTVYLMAVDARGNAVSWIQSLFSTFGSGLVDPQTGIVLQNRGAGFTLDRNHPNVIAPGKRPFHTLTPLLVTDGNNDLRLTIGTPGGHGQSQFLTQVYHNVFTFGMSPQQAVEAARYIHDGGLRVRIERGVRDEVVDALAARGHDLSVISGWNATFGGVQLILIDPASGARRTGADPRREAYGLAY
ncbi:MAG TPA: gamma-glutamyltransferase [Longimicrobiales bacterium]|nr:gamma-glutamyltransferase [Longimicrobiales bacterium]